MREPHLSTDMGFDSWTKQGRKNITLWQEYMRPSSPGRASHMAEEVTKEKNK